MGRWWGGGGEGEGLGIGVGGVALRICCGGFGVAGCIASGGGVHDHTW